MMTARTSLEGAPQLSYSTLQSLISPEVCPGETGPQAANRLLRKLEAVGFSSGLSFDPSNPALTESEVLALTEVIRAFLSGAASTFRRAA